MGEIILAMNEEEADRLPKHSRKLYQELQAEKTVQQEAGEQGFAQQELAQEQEAHRKWMQQQLQPVGVKAVVKHDGESIGSYLSQAERNKIEAAANASYEKLLEKERARAKIEYADGWSQTHAIEYVPTSGARLKATPGKTTTVLGRYVSDTGWILRELGNTKTEYMGARTGGFNLLNIPDELYSGDSDMFWKQYNKPWLEEAIKREDIILLATEPTYDNVFVRNKKKDIVLSGFGREYYYLLGHGYTYDATTKRMIKWGSIR